MLLFGASVLVAWCCFRSSWSTLLGGRAGRPPCTGGLLCTRSGPPECWWGCFRVRVSCAVRISSWTWVNRLSEVLSWLTWCLLSAFPGASVRSGEVFGLEKTNLS